MQLKKNLFDYNDYVITLKDENFQDVDTVEEITIPSFSSNIFVIKKIIDETVNSESLVKEILNKFMESKRIQEIADKIQEELKAQNRQVYLNDLSLILYSILETIQEKTSIEEIWFILFIKDIPPSKEFRELFSFLHGCFDFYQVNRKISFILLMSKSMRDRVLRDVFPQLKERLEEIPGRRAIQ